MKKARLRLYILLSVALHVLLLWLLRFLPPYEPASLTPVAIRMLDTPSSRPPILPNAAKKPPAPRPREPRKATPTPPLAPPKSGGVLAELPKPVREERPDNARIVSRFDSTAQDIGAGEPGARKPSGEHPRDMPPELALPERYSTPQRTPPRAAPILPSPPLPPLVQAPLQHQARRPPDASPRLRTEEKRQEKVQTGTIPVPAPKPEERRFRITHQQEVAMVQRQRQRTDEARERALEEHFARLEKNLPLPSFDAPGVYERGPERPGEGQKQDGGGKYRSIDSFGLKHFSYLIGIQRKIELVFSVPFFAPSRGSIGVPIVGFTIRRNGELAEAVLLRSSGYTVLDKALLEAVKRAAPYGPFPQHLPDGEISIRVYATVS